MAILQASTPVTIMNAHSHVYVMLRVFGICNGYSLNVKFPGKQQTSIVYGGGIINPLTTIDAIWHRLTLATCYQLAQSVLKIGFALAKKAG